MYKKVTETLLRVDRLPGKDWVGKLKENFCVSTGDSETKFQSLRELERAPKHPSVPRNLAKEDKDPSMKSLRLRRNQKESPRLKEQAYPNRESKNSRASLKEKSESRSSMVFKGLLDELPTREFEQRESQGRSLRASQHGERLRTEEIYQKFEEGDLSQGSMSSSSKSSHIDSRFKALFEELDNRKESHKSFDKRNDSKRGDPPQKSLELSGSNRNQLGSGSSQLKSSVPNERQASHVLPRPERKEYHRRTMNNNYMSSPAIREREEPSKQFGGFKNPGKNPMSQSRLNPREFTVQNTEKSQEKFETGRGFQRHRRSSSRGLSHLADISDHKPTRDSPESPENALMEESLKQLRTARIFQAWAKITQTYSKRNRQAHYQLALRANLKLMQSCFSHLVEYSKGKIKEKASKKTAESFCRAETKRKGFRNLKKATFLERIVTIILGKKALRSREKAFGNLKSFFSLKKKRFVMRSASEYVYERSLKAKSIQGWASFYAQNQKNSFVIREFRSFQAKNLVARALRALSLYADQKRTKNEKMSQVNSLKEFRFDFLILCCLILVCCVHETV